MQLDLTAYVIIIGAIGALFLGGSLLFGRHEVGTFKTVNDKIRYVTYSPRRAYIHYYLLALLLAGVIYFLHGTILIAGLIIVLDLILVAEIAHQKSRIILTDNTVIMTRGFIARDVVSVHYGDVKVIELKQNELGRLLQYADLYIDVQGAKTTFVFKRVRSPLQIKRDIETSRDQAHRRDD